LKKSTIFLFKSFNDVDHIAPLLWYSLTKGEKIVVICYGKSNIGSNKILQQIISNHTLKFISLTNKNLFTKLLFWNFFSSIIFLITHGVENVIFDWFRPSLRDLKGHIFFAAKFLNIKTFALPHGYFIYLSDNFNDSSNKSGVESSFSKRNKINRYYLNNIVQQNIFVNRGLDINICMINGNMRFSKMWHNELMQNYYNPPKKYFKILFFTPHWSYNVDKAKTLSLLDGLIELFPPNKFAIIEHTRGSGGLEDIKYSKYKINSNFLSGELIKNTDIIICFGSSIIFEAILQHKFVVNPRYLHSNQTIFDNYKSIKTTWNKNETISLLSELILNTEQIDKNDYAQIIREHIYLNQNEEPIISYYNQIFKEKN
tara:strand:+ start:878 stop:1990 length:1113 start_codon:yes stop_codon:yes gene_type:complete